MNKLMVDNTPKTVYDSINESLKGVYDQMHLMTSYMGAGVISANHFGSKSLFFSIRILNKDLFFSYTTLVGYCGPEGQYKTNQKFSKTTSTHMRNMGLDGFKEVSQEDLENLAAG